MDGVDPKLEYANPSAILPLQNVRVLRSSELALDDLKITHLVLSFPKHWYVKLNYILNNLFNKVCPA
jgi:hypothetical protein